MFFGKKACEACRIKDEKIRELESKLQISTQQLDAFLNNASEVSDKQKSDNFYFDRSLNWYNMELAEIEQVIKEIYGRHGRTEDSISAVNELQFIQQEIKRNKQKQEIKLEKNSECDSIAFVEKLENYFSDDLRFIASNLERFGIEANAYQCYWLRSHHSGPIENSLYDPEFDSSPLDAPLEEAEFGDEWAKIFLSEPIFIDNDKRIRAFKMLCSSLARRISDASSQENYHPDDAAVVELSKRFPKNISGKLLEEIIKTSDFHFETTVQEVIVTSYKSERSHLENRLETKKPFVLPKFLKAVRVDLDEFGEEISSNLFSDVSDILEGIRIEESYGREFKLFHLPEYAMVNIAIPHMRKWLMEQDEILKMPPVDGLEFEHWVSQRLNERNWESYVTRGSGDQGIDVVATKYGMSIGIQCKRYSGSVGNKAIQEAFSGAKHMGLNKAAVLSNSDFTKSAKELAASTGVLLLSPEDIPILTELLGLKE